MTYRAVVLLSLLCVVAFGRCAGAECLDSAHAVWTAHPKAHATWHYIDGQRCWRAGYPSAHVSRGRRSYGMAPVPPLRERLTPEEGRRLADYLLPLTFEERWP